MKKTLNFLLSLLLCFSVLPNTIVSAAVTIPSSVQVKASTNSGYRYNSTKGGYSDSYHYVAKIDNTEYTAFCADIASEHPDYSYVNNGTNTDLNSNSNYYNYNGNQYRTLTPALKQKQYEAGFFGYGFDGDNSEKMWMATQSIIWQYGAWSAGEAESGVWRLRSNGSQVNLSSEYSTIRNRIAKYEATLQLQMKRADGTEITTGTKIKAGEVISVTETQSTKALDWYMIDSLNGFELVDASGAAVSSMNLTSPTFYLKATGSVTPATCTLKLQEKYYSDREIDTFYTEPAYTYQPLIVPGNIPGKSASLSVELEPVGTLKLTKGIDTAENAVLVAIAPAYYDLTGAEYTVYTDSNATVVAKDIDGNNAIIKILDNNGNSSSVKLNAGTYWVKETKKPNKGYKMSTNPVQVEVVGNDTKTFPVTDSPVFDPVSIILTKNDAKGAKVNGAQFTMKYYNSGTATGNPTRTWVFETGKGGSNGQFRYRDADKVSGDALFVENHGITVLLPGRYVVEETLVPNGYTKAEDVIIDVSIRENGDPDVKYTKGDSEVVNPGDAYVLNEVHEGYLRLKKSSADPSFTGDLSNAVYYVYTDAACNNRAKVNNSDAYAELKTNSDGYTNIVALAPGKYYVKEHTPAANYKINNEIINADVVDSLTTTKEYILVESAETPFRGTVTVKKSSSISTYNKSFEGTEYTLFTKYISRNNSENVIAKDINGNNVVFTFNADGIAKETYTLNYGSYKLAETQHATGYDWDTTASYNVNIDTDGKVVVVNATNVPSNAFLTVKKSTSDAEYLTVHAIAGTEYTVYTDAAATVVAKDVNGINAVIKVQDENGNSSTVELSKGNYWVKETTVKPGWVKDENIYPVTIGAAETKSVESIENPANGFLMIDKKIDSESEEYLRKHPIAGTKYTVYLENGTTVAKAYNTSTSKYDIDAIFEINEEGKGVLSNGSEKAELLAGKYIIKETTIMDGYDQQDDEEVIIEAGTTKQKTVHFVEEETYGYLQIQKIISNDEQKEYVNKYGYPNIEFKVYTDEDCLNEAFAYEDGANGNRIPAVLKIGNDGKSNILKLQKGTYYIKETTTGVEYEVNETVLRAFLVKVDTQVVEFTNKPNLTEVDLVKEVGRDDELISLAPQYYSLEGIEFTVYTDANCTSIAQIYNSESHDLTGGDAVLVVKADGTADKITLPNGEYWVKETKNNIGFYENKDIKHIVLNQNIEEGIQSYTVEFENIPKTNPIDILVDKQNEEEVAVKGAIFKVQYFPEMLSNVEEAKNNDALRTWYLRTDNKGFAKFADSYIATSWYDDFNNEAHNLVSDELFKRENGTYVLLPGTYYFEEIFAPDGYAVSLPFIYNMKIEAMSQDETINVYNAPVIVDDLQTVTLQLQKVDENTGEIIPQGYGSFEGAEFKLEYQNPMRNRWEEVGTLTTNANGFVEKSGLKPGSYRITEIKAPRGYYSIEEVPYYELDITEYNTAVFTYAKEVKEQPTEVDIIKTSFDEFGVTYNVPGATLVLIDKDGNELESWETTEEAKVIYGLTIGEKYTIHESNVPSGYLPLEKDIEFVISDNREIEKLEVFNEPIPEIKTKAFFDNETKMHLNVASTKVVDEVEMKRLMKDKSYRLEAELIDLASGDTVATGTKEFTADEINMSVKVELTVDATQLAGHELVVIEKLYRKLEDNTWRETAEHNELTDKEQTVYIPKASTTATDKADNDNLLLNSGDQTIVDTIKYEKLIPGETYKVITTLMDGETGKELLVNGEKIVVETAFVAEAADGTVDVEIKVDGKLVEGKKIVIFEDVFYKDILIALHHDIEDDNQTVYVPEIKTTAKLDGTDKIEEFALTVVDTISYKNLVVGKTYLVRGTLIDKVTGEKLLDAEGNPVVGKTIFVPTEISGEVEVVFELDEPIVMGHTYVAFEEIYDNEKLIAIHADVEDEAQTVIIPEIHTSATFENEIKLNIPEKTKVIDTVSLNNLEVGKVYDIIGELHLGEDIVSTATKKFTAEAAEMEVEVVFKVDGSDLANKDLVVFEGLMQEDILVAVHAELTDEKQTVYFTEIKTQAHDKLDGDDAIANVEKQTIIDTIEYHNLIPGLEYKAITTLVGEDGKALLNADGKEIKVEHLFTPEEADGTVDVEIEFDASLLEGKKIVVFEDVMLEDKLVGIHHDLEDDKQTMFVVEIKTKAIRESDGKAEGMKYTITDTVSYKNLVVGKEYVVKGMLWDVDKEEFVKVGEEILTVEHTFVPEERDGEFELTFEIEAEQFRGHNIVVLEELYDGEELAGQHMDKEDADQTVGIPDIHTNANRKDSIINTITKTVKVVDTVSYKGLVPGKTYTVVGKLMDKDTNKPLLDVEGKEIVAEKTFVAKNAEGTVDVVFTAKINHEKDWHVVVFEQMFEGEEKVLIAVHEDINDKDQYVEFPVPTGDEGNVMMFAGIGGTSLVTASGLIYLYFKKKKEEKQ